MKNAKVKHGMISLSGIDARLTHVNTRIEKHGEDEVLAYDLDFAWDTVNDVLDLFSSGLKRSLYAKDEETLQKKGAELFEDDGHLTALRHPQIDVLKLTGSEIIGGTFTFHKAVTGPRGDIVFGDVKVAKWRVEAKSGGSVTVRFRVQVNPDKKHRGDLMDLYEQGTVNVSVEPPKPSDAGTGAGSETGAGANSHLH